MTVLLIPLLVTTRPSACPFHPPLRLPGAVPRLQRLQFRSCSFSRSWGCEPLGLWVPLSACPMIFMHLPFLFYLFSASSIHLDLGREERYMHALSTPHSPPGPGNQTRSLRRPVKRGLGPPVAPGQCRWAGSLKAGSLVGEDMAA